VPVDLADDWVTPLRDAGFDPSLPTFWLVEGLVMYLTDAQVTRLLATVTGLSAAGSELLVDFVGTSLLTSPMMRDMLKQYADHDMTWRYGTDNPEGLLEPLGWQLDVKMISEVGTELGRWEYPVVPRHVPGVPQGYFVHATR
jgi:methyltransferase (TIGR00027 family)